jgi:hypothetical protein
MADHDREEQRRHKLEELRRAFCEGIDSGPRIAADDVFGRLTTKYAEMAKQKDK